MKNMIGRREMSDMILRTPRQIEQIMKVSRIVHSHYAELKFKILSTAFPIGIIFTENGVTYKYSKDVEDCLKEIDKMEELALKDFYLKEQ